jgi:hypothetical protein
MLLLLTVLFWLKMPLALTLVGRRAAAGRLWPGKENFAGCIDTGGGGLGGKCDGVPHLAIVLCAGSEDAVAWGPVGAADAGTACGWLA